MACDVRVERLRQEDRLSLARFLGASPDACVFHQIEWHEVIEATYRHRVDYWVAWCGGEIVGIFPVVNVRYPLLGTKMVAMPYQYHSGLPLAAADAVRTALVERAIAEARRAGVRYLEIRHFESAPFLENLGFVPLDSGLVTSITQLDGLTLKSLFRGHREFVGYGAKRGLVIRETNTIEGLRRFRALYMEEQRRHGSPQAGSRLFENIHKRLPSQYRLFLALKDDQCFGGLLTLENAGSVFARCSATGTPEARKLHVSKALFWHALSDASTRGLRTFNFGVSARSDAGLIAFKEGWNGTTRPAVVYVLPIRSIAPEPGKYLEGFSLAKRVWRRLPLPLVDRLGQQVTRWVG